MILGPAARVALATTLLAGCLDPLVDDTPAPVGVILPPGVDADAVRKHVLTLGLSMPETMSSTAQDIARGRKTEIGSFNGYMSEEGRRFGIPTPINETLFSLVKLREQSLK